MVQRRFRLEMRHYRVCGLGEMIMPVRVRGAATMPMDVDVARHNRRVAPKGQ